MNTNYPQAILANYNNDYRLAYEFLAKQYLALDEEHRSTKNSRFFEVYQFAPDRDTYSHQVTEKSISHAIDMEDCLPVYHMRRWYYVDDNGYVFPVTIGPKRTFHNKPKGYPHCGFSDIIANGKSVGRVDYTDH